jgi:hypothetical protein
MTRTFSLIAALLSIVLLMSATCASAGSKGPSVPLSTRSVFHTGAANPSINPSPAMALLGSIIYTVGDEPDHDADDPAPTPEPSTILSFGAALLIGGGVLYSLRLRRNRK